MLRHQAVDVLAPEDPVGGEDLDARREGKGLGEELFYQRGLAPPGNVVHRQDHRPGREHAVLHPVGALGAGFFARLLHTNGW